MLGFSVICLQQVCMEQVCLEMQIIQKILGGVVSLVPQDSLQVFDHGQVYKHFGSEVGTKMRLLHVMRREILQLWDSDMFSFISRNHGPI